MSQFTLYSTNSTAQLQASLIRSALADYRMMRVKTNSGCCWHIYRSGQKSQGFCTLSYTGWGKGLGKWWHLTGAIPQQVLNVIATCVGDEPLAKPSQSEIAQVTSRGGSDL